jgi:hypothetical protein
MPVVPMTLISGALMIVVSWFTSRPSEATISRYFTSVGKGSEVARVI